MSTNARPAGGLLGIDDVLRVLERGGEGQLDDHVSAGLHARIATSACTRVCRQMSTRSTDPSAISASTSVVVGACHAAHRRPAPRCSSAMKPGTGRGLLAPV